MEKTANIKPNKFGSSILTMISFRKIVLCICILSVFAFKRSPAPGIYVLKKGQVSFHSNAKLELIKAFSTQVRGIIDAEKRTFAFSISIKSFDGFNSPLQKEHFNENYMESDKYPNATFTGHIIEEDDFTKDGSYNLRAKGKFVIHGVEQERLLQGDLTVKNGTIKLVCMFTVLLSEHDIKIPRIVHEKLAAEINVIVNAEFVSQ
ncbi:MAG: YceI family protein [Ferruginibacter sp.]|nr:YceI family protein [Chitinophagaceae bacterium]MBP6285819.1 YceI family protein [Ferruginibacter sp.]MBU9935384.1 YceI family protein [Ferruginibacter sp.]